MIPNEKTRKLQKDKSLLNNSYAMGVIDNFKARKGLKFIK